MTDPTPETRPCLNEWPTDEHPIACSCSGRGSYPVDPTPEPTAALAAISALVDLGP